MRLKQIIGRSFILAMALPLLHGCSVSDLISVDPDTPSLGQIGNDVVETHAGAVRLYHGALDVAASTALLYALRTGVMTDELQASEVFTTQGSSYPLANVDARSEGSVLLQGLFGSLSGMRLATRHAREALQHYPAEGDSTLAFIGELAGLEGIADLLLAEGFCSGVPLTEFPYGDNFRYTVGYPTDTVLHRALALFDVALAAGGDSLPVATLARVGRGRAWLALGRYDSAAAAVAAVPLSSEYRGYAIIGSADTARITSVTDLDHQIVNSEGGTGLRWLASSPATQDSRIPVTTETVDPDPNVSGDEIVQFTTPVRQAKYAVGATSLVLASGIEARLITAEAQLAANPQGPWLQTLNQIRTGMGLPGTLTDPGTAHARVALLFQERGFWLYLTGHRQGDLRRLAKRYIAQGYNIGVAYPSGVYPIPEALIFRYNASATIAVPDTERQYNALYAGCFNRDP